MRVHPSRAGTGQEAADTLRQRREVRGRVDLVQPGFIEFDDAGLGSLGFIVVTGELDCRDADRDGRPGVEFSWQGSDEGDDVSGRGWAALNPDGMLEGHIYFHLGDDSAFRAERFSGVGQ